MPKYIVFHRTWWKRNPKWPGGKEPSPGRKTTIATAHSEGEARRIAMDYNKKNEPGFLSRKAEFERK